MSNFYKINNGLFTDQIINIDTKFTSAINNKLNATNYNFLSTDIAQNCIATYIDSTYAARDTDIPVTIPSWCNKIRGVLIGGGGGGGSSNAYSYNPAGSPVTTYTYTWTHSNYFYHMVDTSESVYPNWVNNGQEGGDSDPSPNNVNNVQDDDHPFQHQQHNNVAVSTTTTSGSTASTTGNATGGGGGGGGGFVYLSDIVLDTADKKIVKIKVGSGGTNDTNGNETKLTYGTSTVYTITSSGGGKGAVTSGGSGGSVTSSNFSLPTTYTGVDGNAGSGTAGSTSAVGGGGNCGGTTLFNTYSNEGKGGDGGARGTSTGGNAGSRGSNGYYRIYFLAN